LDPVATFVGFVVILSTQYASNDTIGDVTGDANKLVTELYAHGIENVVICNNGVSKNSIENDAKNLANIAKEWQKKGYKVVVVGYSRGGSVALYAQAIEGMNASGIVTMESPIMGAQDWVLWILGFDMMLQGTKDMVKGSESNNKLLEAIGNGSNLPPMLEISGAVARTVASKHAFNIFTPIGDNVFETWKPIHLGKGWLEPRAIDATAEFIHSLEEQSSGAIFFNPKE
jgi:pimeloyl-ACP methyl ester carboxylesterase